MDIELNTEKYNLKEFKEFDISQIKIDPEVRNMCRQNVCGQYGRNHMCPPAIKDITEWEKKISAYKKGVILTKVYQIENSYDITAMMEGIIDFRNLFIEIKEDIKIKYPYKKLLLLGAGACLICDKCAYLDSEPCRFPKKAFPSVEACGIDVMRLSKSAGVQYYNGKNTVTYIGVILYK